MKAHLLHVLPGAAQDRRYTCALIGLAAFGILALLVGLFLVVHALGLGPLAASRKRPAAVDATTLQPPPALCLVRIDPGRSAPRRSLPLMSAG